MVSFGKGHVTCQHTTNRQDGILICQNMRLGSKTFKPYEKQPSHLSAQPKAAHTCRA